MAAINNENNKAMEILDEMYGSICYQKPDGKMYLKGSSILLESTILDSRTFIRALECFVTSVIDGNAYDTLSSITFICTDPRFQKDLNAFIKAFVSSKEVYIPSDYEKWTFDDALLSYVWGQPSFNKLPAIFLYGMVTAISDTGFDIKINNYGGDIAHLNTITCNFAPLFRWDYDVPSNKECVCTTDVTEHPNHSNKTRKTK